MFGSTACATLWHEDVGLNTVKQDAKCQKGHNLVRPSRHWRKYVGNGESPAGSSGGSRQPIRDSSTLEDEIEGPDDSLLDVWQQIDILEEDNSLSRTFSSSSCTRSLAMASLFTRFFSLFLKFVCNIYRRIALSSHI